MNSKSKHNKRQQLINLYGFDCCWCCKRLKEDEITVEHLLPKSHGGSNAFHNLYLACKSCNQARGNNLLPPTYSLDSIGYLKLLEWVKTAQYLLCQKFKK